MGYYNLGKKIYFIIILWNSVRIILKIKFNNANWLKKKLLHKYNWFNFINDLNNNFIATDMRIKPLFV